MTKPPREIWAHGGTSRFTLECPPKNTHVLYRKASETVWKECPSIEACNECLRCISAERYLEGKVEMGWLEENE